jgi:hypothetical protein
VTSSKLNNKQLNINDIPIIVKWLLLFNFVVLWHTTFLASWILDLSPTSTIVSCIKKYIVALLLYIGIPLATVSCLRGISWLSIPLLIMSSYVSLLFNDWDVDGFVTWGLLTNLASLILLGYNYWYEASKI